MSVCPVDGDAAVEELDRGGFVEGASVTVTMRRRALSGSLGMQ